MDEICKLCSKPRKARYDRPGKFYTLCETHYLEYKRAKNKESYARHQEKRVQEKRDDRVRRPDEILEQKRKSDAKRRLDPDRVRALNDYSNEYRKEYRQGKGRSSVQAAERRYIENHRPKVREKNRRRAATRRGADGYCSLEQLHARIEYYGGRCWLCGCDWYALLAYDQTIDHIKPVSKGGSEWPANLRPACRSCNSAKNASWPL